MFQKNYAAYYDLFNSDKPYEKEIGFVYRWANKPCVIFDIGCGTANYWAYYPRWIELFGIDRSPSMASQNGHRIRRADITTFKKHRLYPCATALFDVVNYIPDLEWLKNVPVYSGGYFIFDVWDKKKIQKQGFRETWKSIGSAFRAMSPFNYNGKSVELKIDVWDDRVHFSETHKMYLHSYREIERAACKHGFVIEDIKTTRKWQTWYKLRKL